MNIKKISIAAFCTIFIGSCTSVIAQNPEQQNTSKKIIVTSVNSQVSTDSQNNQESPEIDTNNQSVEINTGKVSIKSSNTQTTVESGNNQLHTTNSNNNIPQNKPLVNAQDNTMAQQEQTTSISLDVADLKEPNILTVSGDGGNVRITGDIKLDGKVIQSIKGNSTQINLSPRLSKGRHIIKISANYSPEDASIKVKFSGGANQTEQQTGGSGTLMQTLILDIQ